MSPWTGSQPPKQVRRSRSPASHDNSQEITMMTRHDTTVTLGRGWTR